MTKLRITIFSVVIIIFASLINTCGPLPTNPVNDPNNVTAKFFINGNISSLVQDKQITIGIIINIPKQTKSIKVSFGDNIKDTVVYCSQPAATTPETLFVTCQYKNPSSKTVTATVELPNSTFKLFMFPFDVVSKAIVVLFDTISYTQFIAINQPDTFLFTAHTDPIGGNISFTPQSTPALDTNHMKIFVNGSKAIVVISAEKKGNYKITLFAQSGNAHDSTILNLTAYNKPVFSEISKNLSFDPGRRDTLLFTATSDSTDTLKLNLANIGVFKTGVVSVLSLRPDTLKIEFTPDEAKTYTFSIAVSGKYSTDTIIIRKVVKLLEQSVWNQQLIQLNAVEGNTVQRNLRMYLTDSTLSGVNFTATKGTINDNYWSWFIPWGIDTIETINIIANYGTTSSALKIQLNIVTGDSIAPEIRKIVPSKLNDTIGSPQVTCKFSISDIGAGVGKVIFRKGTEILIDTSHTDSFYQCVVKDLVQGQKTEVKLIVSDASMKKNTDSLTLNLTYDPKMIDNTPPTILWKAGPKSGDRLKNANGTVTVTIDDSSGVGTVFCKLNNTLLSGTSKNDKNYTQLFTLNKYGKNILIFYATDSSSAHNRDSFPIELNYNTSISAIIAETPIDGDDNVDRLPTFTWTGGDDNDGDTVYYRVTYGLSAVALVNQTAEVKTPFKTVSLAATAKLSSNKLYYWKIYAYTKGTYKDTSVSPLSGANSFKTINQAPVVTLSSPIMGTAKINPSSGILSFNAVDPDSDTLTYSVAVSETNADVMNSSLRVDNLTTPSCALSFFGTLMKAKKYYWQVVATDNDVAAKRGTSNVDSFYTVNSAPVWSTIPSTDSTFYHIKIDLSKYCSDPDGHRLFYKVLTGTNSTISGTTLNCESDSLIITVQAIDDFSIQPCTTSTTFRRGFVNPLMKLIPAKNASFQMGTMDTFLIKHMYKATVPHVGDIFEDSTWCEGQPIHTVSFKDKFLMDSTEVTQADYEYLMKQNPSTSTGNNVAVHHTSWFDAVLYCNARSKRDGLDSIYTYNSISGTPGNGCSDLGNIYIDYSKNGYRLPTEAEWEFACRAGTTTKYYWPDSESPEHYARKINIELGVLKTSVQGVAQLAPNMFNLYDMMGNVAEWCNDWYGLYTDNSLEDPIGPNSGSDRVSRGSYYEETRPSNSFWRTYVNSAFRYSLGFYTEPIGFRCVRTKH